MEMTYFRKGFGLRGEITPQLAADYASRIVDQVKARDYSLEVGPVTFRLAREFGFCYGVDRAVEYAYETRTKFPDRQLYLVGEIIHNPHVNARLEGMGIRFLRQGPDGEFDFSVVSSEDVVILPAFGVTIQDFQKLRAIGCVLVDTTCGSVLNVWKRVEQYARDGFTAVIHGKYWHEETRATASQVMKYPEGRYLVLLNMDEARLVMDFIEQGGDTAPLRERFAQAISPGFDFGAHLDRVGFANQTTMLAGESLAIAEAFRQVLIRRHGPAEEAQHVRTFDTICSATQERQDAVVKLLEDRPDVMLVIGGYNSSNTCHLAALAASHGVRTYHIEDADGIDPEAGTIRHQPARQKRDTVEGPDWLAGAKVIGVTAGASTPNNKVGEAIARVAATLGLDLESAFR
ncbi:MAG: ispH [Gemmatimonadetes bacterium]|nr:ispH [Gemmatimonadota bacterium]